MCDSLNQKQMTIQIKIRKKQLKVFLVIFLCCYLVIDQINWGHKCTRRKMSGLDTAISGYCFKIPGKMPDILSVIRVLNSLIYLFHFKPHFNVYILWLMDHCTLSELFCHFYFKRQKWVHFCMAHTSGFYSKLTACERLLFKG